MERDELEKQPKIPFWLESTSKASMDPVSLVVIIVVGVVVIGIAITCWCLYKKRRETFDSCMDRGRHNRKAKASGQKSSEDHAYSGVPSGDGGEIVLEANSEEDQQCVGKEREESQRQLAMVTIET